MARRGKLVTVGTMVGALALLGVVVWLTRDSIAEWWYLRQLERGALEDQEDAARALVTLRSRRAIPLLVQRFRDAAIRGDFGSPTMTDVRGDLEMWGQYQFLEGSPIDLLGSSLVTRVPEAKTPIRTLYATYSPKFVGGAELAPASLWVVDSIRGVDIGCDSLVRLLRDDDPRVRDSASRALINAPPEASAAIGQTFLDLRPEVVCGAAYALGLRPQAMRHALPSLLNAIREPTQWQRRLLAARYLAAIESPGDDAIDALESALADSDLGVVIEAARSLAKLGERSVRAVDGLRGLLTHDVWVIRREAAEALGAVGPGAESALEDLRALEARTARAEVASVLRDAIEKIIGDFD